eukprot:CAMPEP_0178747862 /NCGR_PEP_ID=MMETSP0744-20121128/8565_1 /TAXON_ID=913974 /ORGANISM="Nitzschia punctata, Strain CCMP561" /LENGTH=98 /DNA_ID=CAMNT_0020401161 /DNA_START=764 /DNA_END=1061 /DNA_ORIENTATION=+
MEEVHEFKERVLRFGRSGSTHGWMTSFGRRQWMIPSMVDEFLEDEFVPSSSMLDEFVPSSTMDEFVEDEFLEDDFVPSSTMLDEFRRRQWMSSVVDNG